VTLHYKYIELIILYS